MCCDNSPTGSRSHCEGTPDYLARSMAHYERSERFFAEARKWYVKGNTTRAAWYTLDAKEERRLGSRDIRKAIETGEIEGVIPERGQRMGNFIGSAPYLNVADIGRALDYYCDVLGFSRPRVWGDPPSFAMPSRDGLIVMLNQVQDPELPCPSAKQGGVWDAYFWVQDVEALFDEFKSRAAMLDYEPTVKEHYNMKEFAVRDPDGHVIAFGQDWPG